MKTQLSRLIQAWLALLALNAAAVTRYVDLNSPNPATPFTNWLTAATNIQDAIDASEAGDTVLVTNGVYATGGRAVYGTMTNRVAIDRVITLQNVNGPDVTIIRGARAPSGTNGDGAIRCVYLTNGATLNGFTLTNGATRSSGDPAREQSGGGVWCESSSGVVSNSIVLNNFAYSSGAGAYGGTLRDCYLTRNSANRPPTMIAVSFGGGACNSTLTRCTLYLNFAYRGGGAYGGTLTDCSLLNNTAPWEGGGIAYGTLNNCEFSGNNSPQGGGAYWSTLNGCVLAYNYANRGGGANNCNLNNCTLKYNAVQSQGQAEGQGGGTFSGTLNNCTLIRNYASVVGGGAYYGTLNNCTLSANRADAYNGGGGARQTTLNNCIIYFNFGSGSGANSYDCNLNFCCTTPMPVGGSGNITNDPAFVKNVGNDDGDLRLQINSSCINAGNNSYAPAGSDADGNPRIAGGTVDMGAYEFQSPASSLSYAWAQQYGLPTDGTVDFADPDGDGANNWHESHADTVPTNALSVLRMVGVANAASGLNVTWQSVSTRSYFLERTTNLSSGSPFQSISINIGGVAGTKTFTDTSATNGGPYFYRVGVQ